MIRILPILLALFLISCKPNAKQQIVDSDFNKNDTLIKIAFGSCNRQQLPNPFWPVILQNEPDLWIWGGDNIYADTEDMSVLKAQYDIQKNQPAYAEFEGQVEITGTWDDHDYGENDGGSNYVKKRESQQLFLDFMNVDQDDPRREQEGIYHSKILKSGEEVVKVIVLDTRFFRSDLNANPDPNSRYLPDSSATATMLGEAQWAWLEKEFTDSKASFHIIVSSIQFLSAEHGYEAWNTMPLERDRFINLLRSKQPANCIILSGDRHISEFSSMKVEGLTYPLIDFTSSGLTHPWSDFPGEPNKLRVGNVSGEKSFGLLNINLKSKTVVLEMKSEENDVQQSLTQNYH